MTFSLVARCAATGMFGVAISSSSPAVAARCSHARATVGAVASQNVTDPEIGTLMLDFMADGMPVRDAIAELRRRSRFLEYRQVLAIDRKGRTTIQSGEHCLGTWSEAEGDNVAAAGNLLANESVPEAIVDRFLKSDGHLGDRLIAGLRAGLAAGGEAGPVHSAGLMLVDGVSWPVADLRCDWTEDCPIETVAAAWNIYKPQIDAYVDRALNPRLSPSFGVPGDE